MHKSWGNAIELNEALERMGADVTRWIFCEQQPSQPLRFGYRMADDVKRRLLTFWNSVTFFVTYANVDELRSGRGRAASCGRSTAGSSRAPRSSCATRPTQYERFWTPGVVQAFEAFVDDLSNWYIRRSRRRFWEGDATALRVLWDALTTAIQVISPVMPFLAEHLWRNLVSARRVGVPRAVAGGRARSTTTLLAEVAEVRRVVELGRQARAASGLKLRQPLRRLVVAGAALARSHADEIAEELRVKEVEFGEVEASELRVKPNLRVLGPKLGAALRDVRAALQEGRFEALDDGRFRVDGHVLEPDEVLVERVGKEGWAVATDDGLTVALDTTLDDELRRERRVLDLIHQVNAMRREAGLELTDRIRLWIPDEDLLAYEERIKEDTLAVSVELGELRLEKA